MSKNLKPKENYKIRVGQNIRIWRDLKGIKQEDLARKIGITAAALSQIENNISNLTLNRLEDVADSLGIQPEQLFTPPPKILFSVNQLKVPDVFGQKNADSNNDLMGKIISIIETMQLILLQEVKQGK